MSGIKRHVMDRHIHPLFRHYDKTLDDAYYNLIMLIAACSVLYRMYWIERRDFVAKMTLKSFVDAALPMYVIFYMDEHGVNRYAVYIYIGMIMCGLGDLLIGWLDKRTLSKRKKFICFVTAMGFFSLGHIAFGMAVAYPATDQKLEIPIEYVDFYEYGKFVYFAGAIAGYHLFQRNHKIMSGLILVYIFLRSSYITVAVWRYWKHPYKFESEYSNFLMMAGLTLFGVSDLILADAIVHKNYTFLSQYSIYIYWFSLALIAGSTKRTIYVDAI